MKVKEMVVGLLSRRRYITVGVVIVSSWWSVISSAELYRCMASDGSVTFTDSLAQLERCAPMVLGTHQSVRSQHAVSESSPQPPMQETQPGSPSHSQATTPISASETSSRMSPSSPTDLIGSSQPNTPSSKQPCPVGINPLNPFSAPPCQSQMAPVLHLLVNRRWHPSLYRRNNQGLIQT
jgi:hypothetical protein